MTDTTIVEAAARFSQAEFPSEATEGQAENTTYTCPTCKTQIIATRDDFETRARERESVLPEWLQRLFDVEAIDHGLEDSDFVDWLCPGCGTAVRTHSRIWGAGRSGSTGVSLTVVFELEPLKS